ncbi:DUF7501 family protein [Halegenticoccus tardaugens]|uniref:DUF7501 family protein n=1 Tax=Halegenticoccus tardaugens TaxID=2071624 RepID=UPI00100C0482|nr:hypothetical protein [Halegenticoccus tardaugens]
MSTQTNSVASAGRWNDPERCPFCGAALEDGGAGFIAHVEARPSCAERFERWRAMVASDIGGEWSG